MRGLQEPQQGFYRGFRICSQFDMTAICDSFKHRRPEHSISNDNNLHSCKLIYLNDDMFIATELTLKILDVTLDWDLTFKPHVTIMLKKHMLWLLLYVGLSAQLHLTLSSLYKTYMLPHIEYCYTLLLGISKSLKAKHRTCQSLHA